MTDTIAPVRQTLVIRDWHPQTNPNGTNSKAHWSVIRKRHDEDSNKTWQSALQAGWHFVPGRVRLTITLVYPRRPLPDADNAVARCKGLIDGLKNTRRTYVLGMKLREPIVRRGWFTDDSTDYLDLHVEALVVPGVRETRIVLEPAP